MASKCTELCEDSCGEERHWSAPGKLRILCVEDNVMHFDFPIWGGEAADMLSDARKVIFIVPTTQSQFSDSHCH